MNKFCPECGKVETKNQQLIKGLCRECFLKRNGILEYYKGLTVIICPLCQSYLHRNKWHPKISNHEESNMKKIIANLLESKIKVQEGVKITNIGITILGANELNAKKINVQLLISGLTQGIKSKESHILEIILEKSMCNVCKKKNSSYYEAKIQIRPRDSDLLGFVRNYIKENNVMISKEDERKFGNDFYLVNKKQMSGILSEVKKNFNVEVKLSNTLCGRKNGKEVYRTTALLRLKE